MCGIAGYVMSARRATTDVETILAMTRSLARRGPDDEGIALFHPEAETAATVTTSESARGAWIGPQSIASRRVVPLELAEDRAKCHFDHRVAIGHRRFSIIDPTPAAHHPSGRGTSQNVCVTLNGEIYNYVELRTNLRLPGASSGHAPIPKSSSRRTYAGVLAASRG